MSGAVLELSDVSASYSTYRALFGVSFNVPEDGIVALLGSNGAGKSTVARVASGLVPSSNGSIRVAGVDVTRLSAHRISALGVAHVPEGRAIFSSLTVEENLTVSFRKRVGRKGVSEALERAYAAFPVLAERRRQVGGTLSGGQQRILSLAKVLAVSPRLLIADELSLGLAPVIVDQVYDGLVAIHGQGCALLVVEQQVDRALAIADRAVLLVKGAVAWEGPAHEARPALEASMLGAESANGARPHTRPLAASTVSRRMPSPPGSPVPPAAPTPPAAPAPPSPPSPPGPRWTPPPPAPPPPSAPAPARPAPPPPATPGPGGQSDKRTTPPPDLWV
jgi:branched-chain amino acid transport system ATP-binding protein